jgi:salicylate hydroxylase
VDYRHRTSRFYRPHLQQALLNHLNPSIIHLNKGFKAVTFNPDLQRLVITFTDGTAASADILLGADGIHSPVRTFFVPTSSTAWTGGVTLRSVFPVSRLSDADVEIPDEATHYWGPGRTFFVSRLGRDLFTIVGSYQDDPDALDAPYKNATWNSEGDVKALREYYKDWSPLVKGIVEATPQVRIYPNTMAHVLDSWLFRCTDSDGTRITLAGDAAHAHGGAFAAGGSLALDDAWAFAASIRHVFRKDETDLPPLQERIEVALKLYEKTRKAHTDRLMKVVYDGNKKKVGQIEKVETDEELRARMKSRGDTSWMHEHDVVAEFQKALHDNLEGRTEARL